MKAIVCLPTRNEIESIETMIGKIRALDLDVMVVDAASTDGTRERAAELGVPVYQRTAPGKGSGVQKALQVCVEKGYDLLVLIDCDHSYPVDKIPELLQLAADKDMTVGARNMGDIQFTHRLGNMFYNTLVNILFGGRLADVNSGLRVLKVDRFAGLLNANDFDIEAQMTCQALKHNMRIKELPIEYYPRVGESKVVLKDAFIIFFRILRERF